MQIRLGDIVDALGGQLLGNDGVRDICIDRLDPLETAGACSLSFFSDARLEKQLQQSQAACVIVAPQMQALVAARGACIVTAQPHVYFARLTQWWKRRQGRVRQPGVHPSAVVHPQAQVHPTAHIGPLCVVEKGAHIGAHTVLESRVTVAEDCFVGERCVLQPGAVIGADGFGFAWDAQEWVKIEQLGAVCIGNDVQIGVNTCVARGALADTVIKDGAKIDSLVQIAHNIHVGRNTAIAGCTGIAGSTHIGDNCTIGGAAMIVGHIHIADNVHIGGGTRISRSIHKPGHYSGFFPFAESGTWEKNAAALKQLHNLRERIRALEKKKPQ